MDRAHLGIVLFTLASLAGCSASHMIGEDAGTTACGPTSCAPGLECCNASCGICAAPGEMCPRIACVDAGSSRACGADTCGGAERCCPGCTSGESFCFVGECPLLGCPPPPGCESCDLGERCCPSCPGSPPICVGGTVCPEVDCPVPPPPGCESCAPGAPCCAGCEGSFCGAPGSPCPEIDCPMPPTCDGDRPCGDDFYCDAETCGGEGVCRPRPAGCTEDCPGVCGCDGETYCNACHAAADGVDVAHEGTCGECRGRDYCDCGAGCEPLIDLSTGCVCPCDDPFNCTGELCACACGGATYLGCANEGECPDTQVNCGPGCFAALDDAGCPTLCACTTPG